MWQTLQSSWNTDRDYELRTHRLQALRRVLDGSLYDDLRYAFHEEYSDDSTAKKYIPLRKRRPSVQYNVCRLVVDDSVAMLFSEGHFPVIEHEDEDTKETLKQITTSCLLNWTMIEAATQGAVGSTVLWLRILDGRIYVQPRTTEFLTPTCNPKRPDELTKVRERYKRKGQELKDLGYDIPPDSLKVDWWWTVDYTQAEEIWYLPQKAEDKDEEPTRDESQTVTHDLGFVPMIWIKNLPGGNGIDGAPTFSDAAIKMMIESDYLLSQAGRGLKYASDPLLMIKEPAGGEGGDMVRSASNAIVVGEKGDAKLVEIQGDGANAVLEFVRAVRELAIEQLHGNRTNADKISAAQSGRAMELMNQALIWLADKLRISYGENGLKKLLAMIVAIGAKTQLIAPDGTAYPTLKPGPITLRWPAWYPPTSTDKQDMATTLRTHTDAGHMSQETAIKIVAQHYDVEDVNAERTKIEADEAKRAAQQPQVMESIRA